MNSAVTEDFFLDGRVRIRQPAKGFRAGVDSVLLAAAIEAKDGDELMEAGCGVGVALLCAAARLPNVHFVGMEREGEATRLARENIALNGAESRVMIEQGDALALGLKVGRTFDGVFLNPPFDVAETAQQPHPARAASYLTETSIEDWIKALADKLRGGAALTLIQRAEHLGAILAALEGRLGGVEILPLRPRPHEPAKRVLVRARKGSRAALRLLKGYDLHDDSGAKFTPAIDAALRGQAPIAWR